MGAQRDPSFESTADPIELMGATSVIALTDIYGRARNYVYVRVNQQNISRPLEPKHWGKWQDSTTPERAGAYSR